MKNITQSLIVVILLCSAFPLLAQTFTFTNAGATGQNGPTQAQINAAYAGTPLDGAVAINTLGIQEWTVPSNGAYRIQVIGATGGNQNEATVSVGHPADISGEFNLSAGQTLKILVGQHGHLGSTRPGWGGGGGSFVTQSDNTPLAVAGGCGSGHTNFTTEGLATQNSSVGITGKNGSGGMGTWSDGFGAIAGQGGDGAGFFGNGTIGNGSVYSPPAGITAHTIPQAFINNGTGDALGGGFGGGGGVTNTFGGGGGGYSGGQGAVGGPYFGGGGASFNGGTNQINVLSSNNEFVMSHGQVIITLLCTPLTVTTTPGTNVCPGTMVTIQGTSSNGGVITWDNGISNGVPFIATTTTTYNSSSTDPNDCVATVTITVEDNEDPIITCPGDITQDNDLGVCGAVVNYAIDATDNCSMTMEYITNGNFETGDLTGWTPVIVGSTAYIINDGTQDPAGNGTPTAPISGNFDLLSHQTGSSNQMISQPILVPTGVSASIVSWNDRIRNYWTSFNDPNQEFKVEILDAGMLPIQEIFSTNPGDPLIQLGPNVRSFDTTSLLQSLEGQTIYLSFSQNTQLNFFNINLDDISLTISSNSTIITQTAGLPSGSVFPVGTTTNTFEVTDGSGNTATCSFDVMINDTEAPVITCPANIIQDNDLGVCGAVVTFADPTATDNCTIPSTNLAGFTYLGANQGNSYYVSDVNFTPANAFADAIAQGGFVATIKDASQNEFLLQALNSLTPPSDPLIGYNDVATEGIFVWQDGSVTTYSNWHPGEPNNTGEEDYTQFYRSTGTWNDVSAGFTLRYVLQLNGGMEQTAGLPSGSIFPVGTTTNTFEAIDASGNTTSCSFDVTVNDVEAPVAVCQNITVELDANGNATIVPTDINGGSTDNCGVDTLMITETFTAFAEVNEGQNLTITLPVGNVVTAVDFASYGTPNGSNGNYTIGGCHATNSQTVVESYALGNNSFTIPATNAVFGDPCGGTVKRLYVTVSYTTIGNSITFTCANVGTNDVMLLVTDVNGNTAICTSTVTVEDNIAPVIACVSNANRDTDPGVCQYTVVGTEFDATFTDNCTSGSISNDFNGLATLDGAVLPKGDTTIVWTVDDGNGQTATCTTVITVEDNEAPVITCIVDSTRDTDPGVCEYTVVGTEFDATFTDNCTDGSITNDFNGTATLDGEVLPTGDTTVIWTVNDGNGQTVTCSSVITVEDNEAPIVACPADINANTDAGDCFATVSFPNAIAFDNCGVDTVVQTAGLPSGSQFPVGINTIEFTATDINGNVATCSFDIIVTDNQAPIAICQNITIQLDANGNAIITAANVDGGSIDQCGVASISIDMDTFDCSHVGDNNVVLTVTDVNGNTSNCTAIVTVEDVTAPIVACQNITVEIDPITGTVTIPATDIDNGSTDACGIATYELDMAIFDCSHIGDNTVTLTVTDVNGNSATCTATVTIEDNTSPVLVCQDFTIEIGADGTAILDPSDVIATNEDACGIFTTAVDITEFSCADIGTPVTVQVFSQDSNGNLSTCTTTVTAVDVLAPVVTCPADQTVDPGVGNLFYILPDYFATGEANAMDNCTDPVTITSQDPAAGTALPDGIYTITLTAEDAYGNIGTCTFELTVDSVLGTNGNSQNLGSIQLYPNPAKNVVTIGNPQNLELEKADIFDLTGRLVHSYNLKGMATSKTLDVNNLAAATYVVVIKGKHGQITKRLLKE